MSTRRIYEAHHSPTDIDDRSVSQILGNMEIMADALSARHERLTIDDLHRWHRAVMESSPQPQKNVGAFRCEQNWIGGRADAPFGADFIPPPPEHVNDLMEDLLAFTNGAELPPIVHAAVAHAQFESIHPYADGNGRIGRVLIYWILASRGVLTTIAPPLSPIIDDDRETYIEGLVAYRNGQPDIWIDTFLRLVESACAYSLLLADALADLNDRWTSLVSDVRAGSVDHRIVAELTEHPVLDAATVALLYKISDVAALEALRRLETRGIVTERPLRRGRRGRPARVFEASDLFELLDEPVRQLAARLQHRN
ncbi:MAG: Fic family protein [Actinomycetota bacterium]